MIKIIINAINYPRGLLYTTPEVSGQRKSTISPSRINWRPGTSAIDASAMMTILLRCVNKQRHGFYYEYQPRNYYGARTCTYARVVVLRMYQLILIPTKWWAKDPQPSPMRKSGITWEVLYYLYCVGPWTQEAFKEAQCPKHWMLDKFSGRYVSQRVPNKRWHYYFWF